MKFLVANLWQLKEFSIRTCRDSSSLLGLSSVSFSTSLIKEGIKSIKASSSEKIIPCSKCGGNGYLKSNPNCYHTCLNCLGKGSSLEKRSP